MYYVLLWRNRPIGVQAASVLGFVDHTHTHTHTHTQYDSSGRVISPWQRPLTVQQTLQTNIHALSGIRIRYPSNQAAVYSTAYEIGFKIVTVCH